MNELDKYLEYAERINLINHAEVKEKLFQGLINQIEYDAMGTEIKLNLPILHLDALNFEANEVQVVSQEKLSQILILIRENKKWIKYCIEDGMRTIAFSNIDGYSTPLTTVNIDMFTDSEYCQETIFNKEQKANLCNLFVKSLNENLQPIFFSFLDNYREVLYMAQVDKDWFKSNE